MSKALRLFHPGQGRLLPPYFVAYGCWRGAPTPIQGRLVDAAGQVVAVGRPYRNDSRLWAVIFTNVPDGRDYTLEVWGEGAVTPASADRLVVARQVAIAISYPTGDDLPVGTTFIVYGNTSVTAGLTAGLSPASGTVRSIFGPPDTAPYWAFEVSDAAPGSYTLSVFGGSSQTDQAIDVQ